MRIYGAVEGGSRNVSRRPWVRHIFLLTTLLYFIGVPGKTQSVGTGAMGCSSMAERRTVNAVVVGSTPTAPVQEIQQAEIAPGAPSLPVVCSILLSYSNRYRFAKTVVLPARSNAITSYGSLLSPISIPGEPVTIPGTAKPVICGF